MSTSYTFSEIETFTVTHARRIASKVATDLLRFQRFYGEPSHRWIDDYEAELVALLKHDYLKRVTYGFKGDGKWVEALRYRALPGGVLVSDDDPGKIRPVAEVSASFSSYLIYNDNWYQLSQEERQAFKASLPFQRSCYDEPGVENGYWVDDRNYTAGGRGLGRSTIRRW